MTLTKNNSILNQYKFLATELKQLDYDFEKAQTLREKVVMHNLIVSKEREREKRQEQINQIRAKNKVIGLDRIRNTTKQNK